jgi:exopolyphosphatase / guanosine-5'-triphosphate,3'-diphosphate pyrophosphatase
MRTAVVDIGSNSTRLLIAELDDGRVRRELVRRTTITRLGAGVDAAGHLNDEAMERVYAALEGYRALIEDNDADTRLAVLTSAVRDAANGDEFAETVKTRFGLVPHILAGDDEARLTFLGATSERDQADRKPTLVIDIGGGSTELVIGTGAKMSFHVSNQAGVVRQTERHIRSDPPAAPELDALAQDARAILARGVPEEHRTAVSHAIAVAGTATSLASIAQELQPYDPEKVEGYVLSEAECRQILDRLAALTLDERRQVKGLHPDRAPTIVAGVVILIEILNLFGLNDVEVSEHDILRGAAIGLSD